MNHTYQKTKREEVNFNYADYTTIKFWYIINFYVSNKPGYSLIQFRFNRPLFAVLPIKGCRLMLNKYMLKIPSFLYNSELLKYGYLNICRCSFDILPVRDALPHYKHAFSMLRHTFKNYFPFNDCSLFRFLQMFSFPGIKLKTWCHKSLLCLNLPQSKLTIVSKQKIRFPLLLWLLNKRVLEFMTVGQEITIYFILIMILEHIFTL